MSLHAAKWSTAVLVLACVQGACMQTAWARSADRNQPMDIDAGQQKGSLDDRSPTVLSGGVTIVQGSLNVAADQAVITTTGGDISRAVLTGRPAKLKQQLDDGTPMSAAANQVDYNLRTEIVVFTGNVNIQQPRGTLSGQRVVYNMKTGEVNSGGQGSGRVKMRILPRNAPQGGG